MQKLQLEELNRLSPEEYQNTEKRPVIIVLDNIRSLNNVGSAFRTADAFGIEAVYLCGITGKPPHRDIHKTALGAQDTVRWEYFEDTAKAIEGLKADGYVIVALEQTSESITLETFHPLAKQKYAFIFGNEVQGVSDEILPLLDACVEIPQFGTKHSLNVSVTMGITLWHHFILSK